MKAEAKANFREITKMLRQRLELLQESVPELLDDEHRLFVFFAGSVLQGIPFEKLKVSDRKGDQKMDFYYVGEDRFVACQCKLPDLDVVEKAGEMQRYGPDVINEIEDVLTFLTDSTGKAKGNAESQAGRNKYRAKREAFEGAGTPYKLEVVLAIFGQLTPPATERLEELRRTWCGDTELFDISLTDYDDISAELTLSLSGTDRPKDIRLPFRKDSDSHTNEWGYALIPAIEFFELFEKHKMSLFDLNVRYNWSGLRLIIRSLRH
jgi:hypothetical protein